MEPFHPLASDCDAPADAVAASEAVCALSLGRLDGSLGGLLEHEKRLFCWVFLRSALLSALTQAGFTDAELRFDAWFAGTDRDPTGAPHTSTSPRAIVRAILAELSRHRWEPLAEAASRVQRMGRFAADRDDAADDRFAAYAFLHAAALARRAAGSNWSPLTFPAMTRLADLAREDPLFSPGEREVRVLVVAGRSLPYEQSAPRSPLWALDFAVGHLLGVGAAWQIALPCPGAFTQQLLRPDLWPGERRIAISEAVEVVVRRVLGFVDIARRRARLMQSALGHLRSTARAPDVWMAAIGFAPLGIEQVSSGFGVSRRGSYTISETLEASGLMTRSTRKGMVILAGREPPPNIAELSGPKLAAPSPALDAFDSAMADIDRLLARCSNRVV